MPPCHPPNAIQSSSLRSRFHTATVDRGGLGSADLGREQREVADPDELAGANLARGVHVEHVAFGIADARDNSDPHVFEHCVEISQQLVASREVEDERPLTVTGRRPKVGQSVE